MISPGNFDIFAHCIFIVGLVVAFFWRTRHNEPITDDFTAMLHPAGHVPPNGARMWWLQLRCKGLWNVGLAHYMNIGAHAATSVMVYITFGHNSASFMAAMMFAFMAFTHQGAVWMSGRPYAMATLLTLCAFALPWVAPIFLYAATFYSFNGIFACLMFAFTKHWWWAVLVPAAMIPIAWHDIVRVRGIDFNKNPYTIRFHPRKIVWYFRFLGYYVVNAVTAWHPSFFHSYMSGFISSSVGLKRSEKIDGYFIAGVAIVVVALCLVKDAFTHPFGMGWGLWWVIINVSMWCNVINTVQEHISSRYFYLSATGLCLFLANVFAYAWVPEWVGPAFILWQAGNYLRVFPLYKSIFWFSHYLIGLEPRGSYSWVLRGNFMFNRGNFMEALSCWNEALMIDPTDLRAAYNRSAALICLRQNKDAQAAIEDCKKMEIFGVDEEKTKSIKAREDLIDLIEKGIIRQIEISQIPLAI